MPVQQAFPQPDYRHGSASRRWQHVVPNSHCWHVRKRRPKTVAGRTQSRSRREEFLPECVVDKGGNQPLLLYEKLESETVEPGSKEKDCTRDPGYAKCDESCSRGY